MKSDEEEYSDFDTMEEDEDVFGSDESMDELSADELEDDLSPEDEEEDDEEEEFVDLKPDTEKKKAFEVAYKVWPAEELEKRQEDMSERVGGLLGLNASTAAMLLRAFKWHEDSLVERYMEDPQKVLVGAGLPTDIDEVTPSYKLENPQDGFMCMICCNDLNDDPDMQVFGLSCGHQLCKSCYGYYVKQKIWEEQLAGSIKCPGDAKCKLIVPDAAVRLLVSDDIYAKYRQLLSESFVNDNELFKFCPGPECGGAIECHVRQSDLNSVVPTVQCSCGYMFCFGCKKEDHMPCPCNVVKMWLKKCQDDSETSNWISANTKDCPKCNSCIEKNGGCNHMTCKKCRYEFCWVCMGDWKAHGRNYYNCSRFDDSNSQNARSKQEKSRAELERYLHYYNRYANHLQSLKLDKETFRKIEKKMKDLQDASGMSWIEVQFLNQAFDVLQRSRRTLTWTYAFAYYLEKGHITTIFEDNQKDLEMATEQLSEIFERPANDLASEKVPMLDKCAYVSQRRDILLEDAARGLAEGTWKYNTPIERAYA